VNPKDIANAGGGFDPVSMIMGKFDPVSMIVDGIGSVFGWGMAEYSADRQAEREAAMRREIEERRQRAIEEQHRRTVELFEEQRALERAQEESAWANWSQRAQLGAQITQIAAVGGALILIGYGVWYLMK